MTRLYHFGRLAILNLRRGGQRVLVALLCITFGVMALVAMTTIAKSIEGTLLVEPAELLGGDLSVGRAAEDYILPEHVDRLRSLQQAGEISRYTLIAVNSSIMFHGAGSGEVHFAGNGMGIEPEVYPLAGSLAIREPANTDLPALLARVGDTVITRDIAQEYDFKVGDTIVLADARVGTPVRGTVRGIAKDTPNHQGDKIYYTIETAQALANGGPVVNTAIVNTAQAASVTAMLDESGWSVDWAAGRRDKQTGNLWILGLRGAGILGLLVAGIGIANTMQVLLRRRQREIAIWKTLGYREMDLRLIFSLEAGLLGLAGSTLGAALGVLISGRLLELLRDTSSVLYEWKFSPAPPLMGILVGTLTTIVFAYWAIVVSCQARPMALLRNEPINLRRIPRRRSALLALLLAAPFAVLTGLVMESAAAGIGVLLCIVMGIGMLGAFFSGALWVCTRVLPLRGLPLLRMAFRSLHRRGAALVFAMIALFAGVLAMNLALLVTQDVREISGRSVAFQGYNLNILAAAGRESAIREAIQAQNPEKVGLGYRTALESLRTSGGEPVKATDAVLVGRSDPQDYIISGAEWGSRPDGVYAYKWANLQAGSRVQVTFRDGTTRILTVAGTYDVNHDSISIYPPIGLLMTADAFTRVARPDSLTYFVQIAPDRLGSAATALGTALPQATVLNLVAYAGRFMRSYRSLFALAMALAGLALLAGILLVANSISLAMLDRSHEIGVLKTVGYSRRQILIVFMVEYGLVGALATGAALLVVQALMGAAAIANHGPAALLLLSPESVAVAALAGVGLILLTVAGVAWDPTRVSPVVVLNERN